MGTRKATPRPRRGAAVASLAPSSFSPEIVAVFSALAGVTLVARIVGADGVQDASITFDETQKAFVWDTNLARLIVCTVTAGANPGLAVFSDDSGTGFSADTNYVLQAGSQAIRNPNGARLAAQLWAVPE